MPADTPDRGTFEGKVYAVGAVMFLVGVLLLLGFAGVVLAIVAGWIK